MKILDDTPVTDTGQAFAVELEIGDDAVVRELWRTAPDVGDYGVPYALALLEGGKIEASTLRAALERFNEPPHDRWHWTVEALAMHLLHDLCGVTLAGWRYPPQRDVCPHGKAYATDDGVVRWLGGECESCIAVGEPERSCVEPGMPVRSGNGRHRSGDSCTADKAKKS